MGELPSSPPHVRTPKDEKAVFAMNLASGGKVTVKVEKTLFAGLWMSLSAPKPWLQWGCDHRIGTASGRDPRRHQAAIWLRDGGRCRQCDTQTELQYDHIIPLVMCGSSNQENLEILCGPCNRRKSAWPC
jgi:hypothetical protein